MLIRSYSSATNVVIDGFTIANGDDAVAIQSGASNVLVKNGFVSHHSHGMSVGSLGQNQGLYANVSNVGQLVSTRFIVA